MPDADTQAVLDRMTGLDSSLFPAPSQPYGGTSLGDLKEVLGQSAAETMSGWYGLQSELAQRQGNEDMSRYNYQLQQQWRDSAKQHRDAQSQDTRDTVDSNFLSYRTWQHPSAKIGTWIAQNLIPTGAGALGEALAGPAGAGIAYGLSNVTGVMGQFSDTVNNMSDEELRNSDPEYNDLRANHVGEQDARRTIINNAAAHGHLPEFAAALGIVGGAPAFGGLTRGIGNVGARMGVSALEGGVGFGAQDLGSNLAVNQALGGIGVPGMSPEEMARSAGGAALFGGITGGIGGIRGGRPSETRAGAPTTDAAGTREGAEPLGLPAPEGHIPGTIYAPDLYRPRPDGYGVYGEGLGGYRGRPTDIPPASQTATPEADATKRAISQRLDEKPVSGQASSKPGTGRIYTKEDIQPQGVAGPFDISYDVEPRDVTSEYDITPTSVPSGPVGDAEDLALSAMGSRWMLMRSIQANDDLGRGLDTLKRMKTPDLRAEYDRLMGRGPPVTVDSEGKPPIGPVETQPQRAQPSVAEAGRPQEAAEAPIQPGLGGDTPEAAIPASEVSKQADELADRSREGPREVFPGEPGYGDFATQVAAAEEAQRLQGVTGEEGRAAPQPPSTLQPRVAEKPSLPTVKPEIMGEGLRGIAEAVEGEEKARATREAVAAAQAREAEITRPEGAGKKWTKPEIAERKANNKVAEEVVERHQLTKNAKDWLASDPSKAGGRGSLVAMISRLRGMVADADKQVEAGRLKYPQEFNIMPSGSKMPDHSPSLLAIMEAKRFLSKLVRAKGKGGKTIETVHARDDITSHLDREWSLTAPHLSDEEKGANYRKLLPERVSEAEERMALQERGPRALKEGQAEELAGTIHGERKPGEVEEKGEAPEPAGAVRARETVKKLLEPIPHHPTGEAATKEALDAWKQTLFNHSLAEHILDTPRFEGRNLKNNPYTLELIMRQFQDTLRERFGALEAKQAAPPPVKEPTKGQRAIRVSKAKQAAAEKVTEKPKWKYKEGVEAPTEKPVEKPKIGRAHV